MKRSFYEKTKSFFINMGKHYKLLRVLAIIGLAFSMLFHRIYLYFKTGTKRFASTAFILLCFMVGNSFAYPVFQEENGFILNSVYAKEGSYSYIKEVVSGECEITLSEEEKEALGKAKNRS